VEGLLRKVDVSGESIPPGDRKTVGYFRRAEGDWGSDAASMKAQAPRSAGAERRDFGICCPHATGFLCGGSGRSTHIRRRLPSSSRTITKRPRSTSWISTGLSFVGALPRHVLGRSLAWL
jgi:hypothetical protein